MHTFTTLSLPIQTRPAILRVSPKGYGFPDPFTGFWRKILAYREILLWLAGCLSPFALPSGEMQPYQNGSMFWEKVWSPSTWSKKTSCFPAEQLGIILCAAHNWGAAALASSTAPALALCTASKLPNLGAYVSLKVRSWGFEKKHQLLWDSCSVMRIHNTAPHSVGSHWCYCNFELEMRTLFSFTLIYHSGSAKVL